MPKVEGFPMRIVSIDVLAFLCSHHKSATNADSCGTNKRLYLIYWRQKCRHIVENKNKWPQC